MRHTKSLLAVCLFGIPACTPFVLAPGAEQVRVTNVSTDVVDCAPVGNIQVPKDANGLVDIGHTVGQLKNQTIGLGGNVAFVTEGTPSFPTAGVAYHCPSRAVSGTNSARGAQLNR
jgi:hypothetical protein